MSVLFATKSCETDRLAGFHEAIRQTWGKHVREPNELRFFVGDFRTTAIKPADETFVPSPDGYAELPYKVRTIMGFFVIQTRHDFIFLSDTDTFCIPNRLLTCGYENYDITAAFIKGLKPGQIFRHVVRDPRGPDIVLEKSYAPPSGGLGYFLSRKAAQVIADTKPDPKVWADDLYVAEALGPMLASGELTGYQPPDYHDMTFHFPKHQYKTNYSLGTKWMERMYRQYAGDFPHDSV